MRSTAGKNSPEAHASSFNADLSSALDDYYKPLSGSSVQMHRTNSFSLNGLTVPMTANSPSGNCMGVVRAAADSDDWNNGLKDPNVAEHQTGHITASVTANHDEAEKPLMPVGVSAPAGSTCFRLLAQMKSQSLRIVLFQHSSRKRPKREPAASGLRLPVMLTILTQNRSAWR